MKKGLFYLLLFLAVVAVPGFSLGAEEPLNDYRIGDGDVLQITVYDHSDLTTVARVDNGGTIQFPLIGIVRIGGQTVRQTADQIAKGLGGGYIVNPQVSVFVQEFRSRKVTVVGQVANPGLYELARPTTLLELISKAGGLKADAGDSIIVKRRGPRGEQQLTIDRRALMEKGDTTVDIPLRDGDNVFVAQAGIFYVTGQVNKPAAYKLEEGASVIKGITMAGGFTNLAATKKVRIIRKVEGAEKVLENVPMHEMIKPEDVIVVPESFF